MITLLFLYSFAFHVFVQGFLLGFIPHVFFSDEIVRGIRWQSGSSFQFEVGIHDGAWGILGLLCIWIRDSFWLATGMGWSLFMLGTVFGHIKETILHQNYTTYNFFVIFINASIAVYILLLLYLYFKNRKEVIENIEIPS